MSPVATPAERLDRLRVRLRPAELAEPPAEPGDRPAEDAPPPRSFSDWSQWSQFRQVQ